MRILVAPQEFKGSLTASEAADVIVQGVLDALPGVAVESLPLSDGGPGLVDALVSAVGGKLLPVECHDPLGRPITAMFGVLDSGAAVIEMAAASGLSLLRPDERDPLRATTFGTGELIRAALDRGCREIIVGVGGSATVDAGAGALMALGANLVNLKGERLPLGGGALSDLDHINLSGVDPRLSATLLRVSSDVRNRLCGPAGAAAMFGPQKGASPYDVAVLEAGLERFADVSQRDCGARLREIEGGGAAGGLAAGLVLCGATIEPGFRLVAEVCKLEARIAAVDFVITGEGRLDEQTPYGKTAWGVAEIARLTGTAVGVIAGTVDPSFARQEAFDFIEEARRPGMTQAEAMAQAGSTVARAASRLATRWSQSQT